MKSDQNIRLYSSARSGRSRRIIYAPAPLIFGLYGIIILLQIPAGYIIRNISFSLGMLISQIGTLLLPVIIVSKYCGLTISEVIPFKRIGIKKVFLSIILIWSLIIITDYLIYLTEYILPVPYSLDDYYREMMRAEKLTSIINKCLFLCLLPSFCEEIFFRGFSQTGLEQHYGRRGGIIIVSIMFAVAHLNPWYLHIYFILGLFLGWLFSTSGTLWIPIICHLVNNGWTFLIHNKGWTLPIVDKNAWINIPIIFFAFIILILAIKGWIKSVKADSGKNPYL